MHLVACTTSGGYINFHLSEKGYTALLTMIILSLICLLCNIYVSVQSLVTVICLGFGCNGWGHCFRLFNISEYHCDHETG